MAAPRSRPSPTVPAPTWLAAWAVLLPLVHLLLTGPVLALQRSLPQDQAGVLATFAVYAPPDVLGVLALLLRGLVLGLALAPFRRPLRARPHPWAPLFAAVWGLSMVGSVAPLPGSIEGVIYTETSAAGHALILAATALEALALAWLIPTGIARLHGSGTLATGAAPAARARAGTVLRFVTLHVASYFVIGLTFLLLQDYAGAFATQEAFAHYRPLDHPLVALAIPLQIPRGLLLALALPSLTVPALRGRWGWLALFGALYGTTLLASADFPRGALAVLRGAAPVTDLTTGLPEVTVQMLLFAWAFVTWERRARARDERRAGRAGPTATEHGG